MIERNFDISFIADLAFREKQIQQNYRPVIAVHKWFARRPGTLFRGLLLSEFSKLPLREAFYRSNKFPGIRVADPFMGGGTPLLEANRVDCDVIGFDINPMSYWIVKQEIEYLNIEAYNESAKSLRENLEKEIGHFYRTRCLICGTEDAHVKYFLWVKVRKCHNCDNEIDLFPGYLLAGNARHPKNVFICLKCGELTETDDRHSPGMCHHCQTRLSAKGPARNGKCECPHCGTITRFPDAHSGPLRHRMFAIEYHCTACKSLHKGRFFKKPDDADLSRYIVAESRLEKMRPKYVPSDVIPSGDETTRLHRWGYSHYREMFNGRQLLGLELSSRLIKKTMDERIRGALATNLSDLLRYQNMLCRYDTMALKSLDIFSIHGFPVGLIQCESNFLGIMDHDKAMCIGSGGWANIIGKFRKAKSYCDSPFEIRYVGRRKEIVPIKDEWIGDHLNEPNDGERRAISISCADAAFASIPTRSLDAVFTDPPYFGNVQYAELMDFCYIWLRRLVGENVPVFSRVSTRNTQELTGNEDMGRGLEHFSEGISLVFQRMESALKPGAPFAFTYHHNDIKAYYPVAVAILDAGLTCSATLPCPAEMGASIHISGTGSSIVDTVFICRSTGTVPRKQLPDAPAGVAILVNEDIQKLMGGNVKPTSGDIRCIIYGHLIRLTIWSLRKGWNKKEKIEIRIAKVADWLQRFGGWREIEEQLTADFPKRQATFRFMVRENIEIDRAEYAEISF